LRSRCRSSGGVPNSQVAKGSKWRKSEAPALNSAVHFRVTCSRKASKPEILYARRVQKRCAEVLLVKHGRATEQKRETLICRGPISSPFGSSLHRLSLIKFVFRLAERSTSRTSLSPLPCSPRRRTQAPRRIVCACFLAQPVREMASPTLDDAGALRKMQAVVVGALCKVKP
jgi:hypothetical protein